MTLPLMMGEKGNLKIKGVLLQIDKIILTFPINVQIPKNRKFLVLITAGLKAQRRQIKV